MVKIFRILILCFLSLIRQSTFGQIPKNDTIRNSEGMYVGKTQNGLANGNGKMTFKDGSSFEGLMLAGKMERGKYTWPNGDVFIGEWPAKYKGTEHLLRGKLYTRSRNKVFSTLGKLKTIFSSETENIVVVKDKHNMLYAIKRLGESWIRWDLAADISYSYYMPSLSSGTIRVETIQIDSIGQKELVIYEKWKVNIRENVEYTEAFDEEEIVIWNLDSIKVMFAETIFREEKLENYQYKENFNSMNYMRIVKGYDCNCKCWEPYNGGPWRFSTKVTKSGFRKSCKIKFEKDRITKYDSKCCAFDQNYKCDSLYQDTNWKNEVYLLKNNIYRIEDKKK